MSKKDDDEFIKVDANDFNRFNVESQLRDVNIGECDETNGETKVDKKSVETTTSNSKKSYSFERDYNRVNKVTKENINPGTEKLKFSKSNEVDATDEVSKEKRIRFEPLGQSFESDSENIEETFSFVDKTQSNKVSNRGLNDISNSYNRSDSKYKRHLFNSQDFPSIEEYPDGMIESPMESNADNFANNLSFDYIDPNPSNNFVCSDYGHSSASNASSSIQHHHHHDSVKRGTFSRSLSNADVPSDDNGKSVDNTSLRSSDTQLHQTSSMDAPTESRRRGKGSGGIKHSNSGTSDKSGNSSDRGERSERGERSSNLGKKSSSTSQLSATGRT
ncbi:hypothetical protein WDU94_002380 [Cyamophila willieti]